MLLSLCATSCKNAKQLQGSKNLLYKNFETRYFKVQIKSFKVKTIENLNTTLNSLGFVMF